MHKIDAYLMLVGAFVHAACSSAHLCLPRMAPAARMLRVVRHAAARALDERRRSPHAERSVL